MFVSGLESLIKFLGVIAVISTLVAIYLIYHAVSAYDVKETKSKPSIDYRIETKGKTVDTIWIYKFNN